MRSQQTRLFLILFALGFAGVVSLLLIDFDALLTLLPSTTTEITTISPALKLLSMVQPSLILAVAVVIGIALAPRVGLRAPAAEAFAGGRDAITPLKAQLGWGVIGGLIGGVCIVLISLLTKPLLSPQTVDRISQFTRVMPLPTRLLYGGITEELLLRWGFMTLLVWAGWRLFEKQRTRPSSACFVAAIVLSSLVFGAGHLPVAYMLLSDSFGPALVLFVILANSAFGIVAGYLYWKRGLEAAMIAHMLCHVVLVSASAAGAYF